MSERDKRGLQGVQGIQGVQGTTGEQGESAPGSQGEKGERGPTGTRAAMNTTAAAVFFVLIAVITAGWWLNEHDSCVRTNSDISHNGVLLIAKAIQKTRADSARVDLSKHDMAQYAVDHAAVLRYAAIAKTQQKTLDCGGLTPAKR